MSVECCWRGLLSFIHSERIPGHVSPTLLRASCRSVDHKRGSANWFDSPQHIRPRSVRSAVPALYTLSKHLDKARRQPIRVIRVGSIAFELQHTAVVLQYLECSIQRTFHPAFTQDGGRQVGVISAAPLPPSIRVYSLFHSPLATRARTYVCRLQWRVLYGADYVMRHAGVVRVKSRVDYSSGVGAALLAVRGTIL